jgi:hypothetical protein
MTITIPDEAVEAGAKVQWDRDEILSAEAFGHNKLIPWEEANGLDRAEYMRDARAVTTTALEQMVASGRAFEADMNISGIVKCFVIRLDGDK